MKPILLVIACIMLLIWVVYQHRGGLNTTQATSPNSKDIKEAYEFLPEARLHELIY